MIGEAINRSFAWGVRKIGWETIVPFSLLTFIFLSLAFGLKNILGRINSDGLATTALLAVLTGWLMGRSRFRLISSFTLTILTGLLFVFVHTLELWTLLSFLLQEAAVYAWRAMLALTENSIADASALLLLWADIALMLTSFMARMSRWWFGFISGVPSLDPEVAIFMWSLGLWCVAGWASWWYRRTHQPLLSLLPAGILLAGSLSYARASTYFLVPFIFGLFALTAWSQYHTLQDQWQQRQTDVAEDILSDFAMWVLALSIAVIFFSLLFSLFSPQTVFRRIRTYAVRSTDNTQEISQALGIEQQSAGVSMSSFSDPGVLPRSHLIGAPPELSKQVALIIQINPPEASQLPIDDKPLLENLYFKALTYDVYTGRGWKTSPTLRQKLSAGNTLTPADIPAEDLISQTIQFGIKPGEVLYYTGTPYRVNQTSVVESRETRDERLDIYALSSQNSSNIADLTIDSILSLAGEAQLRTVGRDYPEWVLERYLQLPEEFPARVRDLAIQITQDLPTAYDQAKAIETYLRSYPYSLQVPAPPQNGDLSAYFLFDLQKGYCDYFATSMTVMARSVGLPSRLVVGYASGLYSQQDQRYILTAADAHSWVEIYFPGIGWIEFEPTAGLEGLTRPSNLSTDRWDEAYLPPNSMIRSTLLEQKWIILPAAIAALFVSMMGILLHLDILRLTRLNPTQSALMIYLRFVKQARKLGIQSQPNLTPNEWMQAFSDHPEIQNQRSLMHRLFKYKGRNIHTIISNYNLASYSALALSPAQQKLTIQAWRTVRFRLWLARLWTNLRKTKLRS
jgi:transglutaminase-like putative cysteine protease